MDLWETFSEYTTNFASADLKVYERTLVNHFWFCRNSITFQGHGSTKTIISTGSEVNLDTPKFEDPTEATMCTVKPLHFSPKPFWSVFAFRGGGGVAFRYIGFQANTSSGENKIEAMTATFITVWDIADLSILNCTFGLFLPQRAVAAFYSAEEEGFSVRLQNSVLHSRISGLPHPGVLFRTLSYVQAPSSVNQTQHQSLWPPKTSKLVIRGSTFKADFQFLLSFYSE